MYSHSHLRTCKDITCVYCTYRHVLKWPERFGNRLFTMLNMNHIHMVHIIDSNKMTYVLYTVSE